MAKHKMLEHPGEEVTFQLKVLAKHKSAFERQVTEAVLIEVSDDGRLLNSKGEFNRCVLPRLQVAVGEKVAEYGDNRKERTNFDGILTARQDVSKRKHRELSDNFERDKSLEKNLNVKKDERKGTLADVSDTSNSFRKILKPKKSKNNISPPQNYVYVPLSRMFEKTEYRPRAFGSNDRGSSHQDNRTPG